MRGGLPGRALQGCTIAAIFVTMQAVVAPLAPRPAPLRAARVPPRPTRALFEPGGQGGNAAGPAHQEQQQHQQQQPSIQHPLFPEAEAERRAALGQWRVQTQRGLPLFKTAIPNRPCPVCGGTGKSTCGDCRWALERFQGCCSGPLGRAAPCTCAFACQGLKASRQTQVRGPHCRLRLDLLLQRQGATQLPRGGHAAAGRVAAVVSSNMMRTLLAHYSCCGREAAQACKRCARGAQTLRTGHLRHAHAVGTAARASKPPILPRFACRCPTCRASGRWCCASCMGTGVRRSPIGFRPHNDEEDDE